MFSYSRIRTLLGGVLLATAFGVSNARAATFTNGPSDSSICLDVAGGNPANGAAVQSFRCNATFAQTWNLLGVSVNGVVSGMCLDVAGGKPDAGTPVQLFQCNGTDAQRWRYAPGGGGGVLVNDRTEGGIDNDLCLDVGNGADRTRATIQPCNGGSGQVWVIR